MSWRRKRQSAVILAILIFLILVAGTWWYFTKPVPTCFDGKQDQGELGVDCGGSCAKVCPAEALPLSVVWVRPVEISPGNYSAVAYIENPNRLLGVPELPYTVTLFDSSGREAARREGKAFANPNERFAVFESAIPASAGTVSRAFISFPRELVWRREYRTDLPPLVIRTVSFGSDPYPRLVAEAHNESVETLSGVPVVVVLSDVSGNVITASRTYIDQLAPDATTPIYFTWPVALPGSPATFDYYPHQDLGLTE